MTHFKEPKPIFQFIKTSWGRAARREILIGLKSIGRAKRCGLHTNDSVIILSLSCNCSTSPLINYRRAVTALDWLPRELRTPRYRKTCKLPLLVYLRAKFLYFLKTISSADLHASAEFSLQKWARSSFNFTTTLIS